MTTIRTVLKTVQLASILGLIAVVWSMQTPGLEALGNEMWRLALIAIVASSVTIAATTPSGSSYRVIAGVGFAAVAGMILLNTLFAMRQHIDFLAALPIPYPEIWRVLIVVGLVCAIALTVRRRTVTEPQPQPVQPQNVMQQ